MTVGDKQSVYVFGSNGNFQLGLGHDEDLSTPSKIKLSDIRVKQVASGGNHSLILSSDGKLYGCGLSSSGQLGTGSEHVEEWTQLYAPFRSKLATAGWEFTIVVSVDDKIWVSGSGPKGELGIDGVKELHEFKRIESFPPENRTIISAKAGLAHAVILLDDGSVYGWGASRKGQLGCLDKVVTVPKLITRSPTITHIGCGRDFTVIGHAIKGMVEVFGSTRIGVESVPANISAFKDLQTGWSAVHLLMNDGSVLSWGNNSHSQLREHLDFRVVKLSAGTEHVLAITDRGGCIAWGWGEHGNCGENYADGDVNLLEKSGVTDVWAGYATSFYACS